MDSIHLTLNIEKTDLLILVGIALLLIIATVWLIAWVVKTRKQNRVLKGIDNKLAPQQCVYARNTDVETRVKKEEPQIKESVPEIEVEHEGGKLDIEADVLEEIHKMMIETERSEDSRDYLREHYNTGKSGKVYSREDVEKLIAD